MNNVQYGEVFFIQITILSAAHFDLNESSSAPFNDKTLCCILLAVY